jgi:monooxygenase
MTTDATAPPKPARDADPEGAADASRATGPGGVHVDVLIIGAGLSGIGAAHHLHTGLPDKTYTILESRDAIGGTWDLFRYPGVRSDSDMQTLGYRFRPWTQAKSIADGPSILEYIRETAAEAGIDRHIRFGHRAVSASWSSAEALWTVQAAKGADGGQADGRADGQTDGQTDGQAGEQVTFTCNFLYVCSGYYRYDEGYTPTFPGIERFGGRIVHPQHWPQDLDYAGKRVVVIGSGATAVTLVPAMADQAAHVTMLQRSPTYIMSLPSKDPITNGLRAVLGSRASYPVARWKNVLMGTMVYRLSRSRPELIKAVIRRDQKRRLPAGYDVDTHFAPRYNPWDQRLCLVPDGDLYRAIRERNVSVVTDRISTFTESGLDLESGAKLGADVVVTATGLNILLFGGLRLAVDGREVLPQDTLAYKGMMLSGVPNFIFTVGYTNASWTLKADLVSEYAVRLLKIMAARGHRQCVPVNPDPDMETRPLLDFAAGYVLRSAGELPKSGPKAPWRLGMNYAHDLVTLRYGKIQDAVMRFSGPER